MGRSKSLVRHEVLLPGDLLPSPQPGRWHGVITCVKPKGDPPIMHAWIVMSDIKARLQLPVLGVEEYVLPVPAPQPPLHTFGSGMSETIPLDWLPPGQQGTSAKAADRKRKAGRAAAPSATRRPAIAPPGSAHIAPAHKARKAQHDLQDPPGPAAPREGPQLVVRLAEADAARSEVWPAGTRLWVKLRGSCPWPVVMWSLELCRRKDIPQLLTAFHQGQVLVRFYGEHSSMWVRPTELEATKADEEDRERALRSWGRQHHKGPLVAATLDEIADASPDCKVEVARMMQLQTAYLTRPEAVDECDMCHEEGASISCPHCDRMFHTLCLQPPALTKNDLPDGGCWACPYCGEGNRVGEGVPQDAAEEHKLERMGLTPDWIIQAGAFKVFGLEAPTAEQPFIKGLLDPCTNSLLAPNIPAEKLYDKQLNGLKLSNSWAGYHIVLNPDFGAQTQWRFVNRAIDEVENDQVPAVLLICRNSTDTAYFQRLRPYPRVLLRRMSALFKDYDKTPIGFGIVVFCIAKSDCRALYSRFYDAFSEAGEPNIPIDRELMETGEFRALLDRLRQHAQQHHRDHWIECNLCGKWRIITYEAMMAAKDDNDWTCKKLRPPYTSCRTPQCKRELLGGRQARIAANRAFLASLQLGPQAIHSGQVAPLAPSDPSMIAAARELAKAAAVAEARKQLEGAKRHWAAKRQSRQKEAARLRAALAELAREELQEAEQLVAAEKALQDLLEHHECWH
ncbi:hypothetical protein WJX72_006126 [[Myrmecia] bisecta]|uniref:Uncharacterized protein n=1 Tax=[Myrmecia] bisecta TaxID=41462 RepID=A0AAW1PGD0_9CHLO